MASVQNRIRPSSGLHLRLRLRSTTLTAWVHQGEFAASVGSATIVIEKNHWKAVGQCFVVINSFKILLTSLNSNRASNPVAPAGIPCGAEAGGGEPGEPAKNASFNLNS